MGQTKLPKARGLVDTFNIPYTARINGTGIDAIEGARRHPDQPSADFPSVSYNIVYNTMNIGQMNDSPVQQGGIGGVQTQRTSCGAQDHAELRKLVSEIAEHLAELQLDSAQEWKARAQIATLEAQLGTNRIRS